VLNSLKLWVESRRLLDVEEWADPSDMFSFFFHQYNPVLSEINKHNDFLFTGPVTDWEDQKSSTFGKATQGIIYLILI
jgi:hypothetical protein